MKKLALFKKNSKLLFLYVIFFVFIVLFILSLFFLPREANKEEKKATPSPRPKVQTFRIVADVLAVDQQTGRFSIEQKTTGFRYLVETNSATSYQDIVSKQVPSFSDVKAGLTVEVTTKGAPDQNKPVLAEKILIYSSNGLTPRVIPKVGGK